MLSFAKTIVQHSSNLKFGPEVGIRRPLKADAPVVESWFAEIDIMVEDLCFGGGDGARSDVILGDARSLSKLVETDSIDVVFTSPPYPNEKDYSRTTRLEAVLLGFISTKENLREIKKSLLRSNTRSVYKGDNDDIWVKDFIEIDAIAEEIERRRINLNKTSGFERLYAQVTRLYFGGMARHLSELRACLKPGAMLAYVVGDQASYLRVMINTSTLLGRIAHSLGYEVIGIENFRHRFSTTTKVAMNEDVLILRWNGRRIIGGKS